MKKVYIVFECDAHRSLDTYCIKLLTSNKREAIRIFKEGKPLYDKDMNWYYNVGEYEPSGNENSNGNVLRDLEIILTTE